MKRLAIFLLALVVLWGAYVLLRDRDDAPAPAENPSPQAPEAKVDWRDAAVLGRVKDTLMRESPELQVDKGSGITFVSEADLTGDGIPEVLVDAGVGGAYTSSLVLIQLKNSAPAVAQLRTKDGDIIHADSFLEGASVRNGEETNLLPERGGVLAAHYSTVDGIELESCEVEAYVWNGSSGLFEYGAELSSTIQKTYCADIQARLRNSVPE